MNPIEARAALDNIDAAQRELALKNTQYPLWRHAAFGAVMGALVLSPGLALPYQMALLAIASAGVAWLAADDRRRYGVFINGYRKGRTLPLTLAMVAALLLAVGGEIYARVEGLQLAIKLGVAGFAFVVAMGASLWWTRIYRRELLNGAG